MRLAVAEHEALSLILNRRSPSPRNLAEPVPSQAQLELMVPAAAASPAHKRLRPVRFMIIPAARRAELADAFRAAKLERDPASSTEDLDRAAEKAFRGPMLIAIVLHVLRDHPRVSVSDQMISAGAAVQNMLLAAAALGFAGCLRSGGSATSRKVREALRIAADEDVAAFLMIGKPTTSRGPRNDQVAGLLSVWSGKGGD